MTTKAMTPAVKPLPCPFCGERLMAVQDEDGDTLYEHPDLEERDEEGRIVRDRCFLWSMPLMCEWQIGEWNRRPVEPVTKPVAWMRVGPHGEKTFWLTTGMRRDLTPLYASPAAQEAVAQANYPAKCPITQRPFFMEIEHPELGWVPTYGGPYDSYTIPEIEGEPGKPCHEYELTCEHYDHDHGAWMEPETTGMHLISEDALSDLMFPEPAPSAAIATSAGVPLNISNASVCSKCGKPAHCAVNTLIGAAASAGSRMEPMCDEHAEPYLRVYMAPVAPSPASEGMGKMLERALKTHDQQLEGGRVLACMDDCWAHEARAFLGGIKP